MPNPKVTLELAAQQLINPLAELTEEQLKEARLLWARSRVTACEQLPYVTGALYQFPINEEALPDGVLVRLHEAMTWTPHSFHQLLLDEEAIQKSGRPRTDIPEPAAIGAFHVLHEFGHFLLETMRRCSEHRSLSSQGFMESADPETFWKAGCIAVNDWLREVFPLQSYTALTPEAQGLPQGRTHEWYYEQIKGKQLPKLRGGDGRCHADRRAPSAQQRMFEDAVRAAVAAAMPPGDQPGSEMLQFKARFAPQANLAQKLVLSMMHAHRASGKSNPSFTQLHRKQAALGFGASAPRLVGRKEVSYAPVAVILDVSGSVTCMQEELDQFASEFDSLIRAGVKVFLIVTDAIVQSAGYVTEFKQAVSMLKGGGGTVFNEAFDRLKEEEARTKFAGCFILTDGEIYNVPETAPFSAKAYWVVYGGAAKPAPWGELIRISHDKR